MTQRRSFFRAAGVAAITASAVSRVAVAAVPEAASRTDPAMAPPLMPPNGRPYQPVATLNGWSLPWRMNDGVKEFHLVAEPVGTRVRPGLEGQSLGLQRSSSPGPTIEAVEGDRVRIFVTNRLPEHTTIHWHGILLPSGMDGVGGLSQPQIEPGETFVYEFTLKRSGTHMYHPHADEMVQMALGMMGLFIVHPERSAALAVDRDFGSCCGNYEIKPGTARRTPSSHARLQHLDLEQPGVPGHRPVGGRARAIGSASGSAT